MALPIKTIFAYSRFKAKDRVSSSNFKFQLEEVFLMPHNAGFYVDDISIPHTWYTVEANYNDKLYIRVSPIVLDAERTGLIDVIVTIAPGFYNVPDLAVELRAKIRAQSNFTLGGVTNTIFTVSYDLRQSSITIACIQHRKFKTLTPDDIENN